MKVHELRQVLEGMDPQLDVVVYVAEENEEHGDFYRDVEMVKLNWRWELGRRREERVEIL